MTTLSPGLGGSKDVFSAYLARTRCSPINGHASELIFSPSPERLSYHMQSNGLHVQGNVNESYINENTFCHARNMSECVSYINQEVTSLGMGSLYDGKSHTYDPVRLINCTHDLLHRLHRTTRVREELENRFHRQGADVSHLREMQLHLGRELENGKQENVQLQERERQLLNKNKLLTRKLKSEKEEVKRLQSVIQHRDAQYKHEIKKKEREQSKLRDKVHLMLTDKKAGKIGMEISSLLSRTDGKRKTWPSGAKHEEELYRQVISNYEEKQKELMVENSGLRSCLNQIQQEVISSFRAPSGSEGSKLDSSQEMKSKDDLDESDDIGSLNGSQDKLHEGHFQMPYEYLEGNLLKTINERCKQLRRQIKQIKRQQSSGNSSDRQLSPVKRENKQSIQSEELEKLKKDNQRYRDIIEQQEIFIQQGLQTSQNEAPSFLNESDVAEEKQRLDIERKLFEEQKSNFLRERKLFTDSAVRFNKDKKKFEEDRMSYIHDQFLAMTPFQDRTQEENTSVFSTKSRSKSFGSPHLRPSTPNLCSDPYSIGSGNVTPSCSHIYSRIITPSTGELFKKLGLAPYSTKQSVSRPRSADPSGTPGLGYSHLSPPWASNRRAVSAVNRTSTPGNYGKSRSSKHHADTIKLMLFNKSNHMLHEDENDN